MSAFSESITDLVERGVTDLKELEMDDMLELAALFAEEYPDDATECLFEHFQPNSAYKQITALMKDAARDGVDSSYTEFSRIGLIFSHALIEYVRPLVQSRLNHLWAVYAEENFAH